MKTPALSSRAAAFALLHAVLRKKQAFDDALEIHLAQSRLREAQSSRAQTLSKRDRAFVHMLAATVLRRLGQIDAAIRACLDKPQELKADALDILRLGAAQLLFLATPPHAAVDTAVDLAASMKSAQPYKKLVNAVLRRLSREGEALLAKQDAARLNTPDWLWLSWRKAYGVAMARKIAEAHLGEAPVDVTVKADAEAWAEKLGATMLPTGSLRLSGDMPLTELPGFDEGAWWVQDAAAALPVKLLGNVQGQRVVDLCAAPGGKTLQLAAQGAHVTAVDRSAKRLERLKENLARTKLEADVVTRDALAFVPDKRAEFVLLDAPCSATGTIRRHPDIPRLKTPDDMARMAELQRRLLDHAAGKILAPGGTLVYAVCSLQPEESEQQIEALLERHPKLKRSPIRPDETGGCAEMLTPAGDLRCLPCHWPERGGLDGFYAARLMNA
ncbi:MAG: transcription antitermination factor NusB [Alphaproteobacteria bacterium]|nr:transcription antitermination factor NusB [Alphaproteobacteria bacterium]